MPTRRIILLDRPTTAKAGYRYVLWADVPAGNQIAYRNSSARSAYANATPAELQAIRDGLVVERAGHIAAGLGTSLTALQASLVSNWSAFQSEITSETPWAEYGRYYDNTGAWLSSPGVPMAPALEHGDELPTYHVLTPISAFAANKFQLVLANAASATLGQGLVLKIRLVAILSGVSATTGVNPGEWTLRRREAYTTAPAGGVVAIASADVAQPVPAGITAHQAPTTAPAGGTTTTFTAVTPQGDEQKLTTADAPTMVGINSEHVGQVIYRPYAPWKPITLRAGQTLELQQSGTAGTGNCRILTVFTVG